MLTRTLWEPSLRSQAKGNCTDFLLSFFSRSLVRSLRSLRPSSETQPANSPRKPVSPSIYPGSASASAPSVSRWLSRTARLLTSVSSPRVVLLLAGLRLSWSSSGSKCFWMSDFWYEKNFLMTYTNRSITHNKEKAQLVSTLINLECLFRRSAANLFVDNNDVWRRP